MHHGITGRHKTSVYSTNWDPGACDAWTALLHQVDHTNLAQSPQWFTVIQKTYGHTPLYLKAEDADGQVAVLPAFLVRSRLFGTVVCSMPFLDTGGPCSPSDSLARVLVDSLIEEAVRLGASLVELRCTVEMALPVPANKDKVTLVLPLPGDPGSLWQQFNAKVRNQVRKAERSGLAVEFGRAEKLDDFYAVFSRNMRDLGSPVHAQNFFGAILDAFGDDVWVALVRKGLTPIGGLIALALKDTVVVPWASSLKEYLPLCPNMLLYWETMRAACQKGFQRFDFGRSSRDSNTYRFKRQWGALEEALYWYTIPIGANHSRWVSADDKQRALLVRLWRHLPLGVAQWLGPPIRKRIIL